MDKQQQAPEKVMDPYDLLVELCKVLNITGPVARIVLHCDIHSGPAVCITRYLHVPEAQGILETFRDNHIVRIREEKIGESTSGG